MMDFDLAIVANPEKGCRYVVKVDGNLLATVGDVVKLKDKKVLYKIVKTAGYFDSDAMDIIMAAYKQAELEELYKRCEWGKKDGAS